MLGLGLISWFDYRKERRTERLARDVVWATYHFCLQHGHCPGSLPELLSANSHGVMTRIPLDAWGAPFHYVPADSEKGYGSVISRGARGWVHRRLLWRPAEYEWRFGLEGQDLGLVDPPGTDESTRAP